MYAPAARNPTTESTATQYTAMSIGDVISIATVWIGDTTRFAIEPLTRSDWTSIGGTIKAERPQIRLRYAIVRSAR